MQDVSTRIEMRVRKLCDVACAVEVDALLWIVLLLLMMIEGNEWLCNLVFEIDD